MRPEHAKEDYSNEMLENLKGQPKTCRFRQGHGVYGGIFCTHSDFYGYACIEDYCLSCFERNYREENYSPKAWAERNKRIK